MQEGVILVGGKGPMSYVLAVVTQFGKGSDEVVLKARGRAISNAVDVAEIYRNKFNAGAKVKDIQIKTEEVQSSKEGALEGMKTRVSAIEITIARQ